MTNKPVTNGRPGASVRRNPRTVRLKIACPHCEKQHVVRVSEKIFPKDTREHHFKLAEVSTLVPRSIRTLKRHIYSGRLKATKLGGRDWFVKSSDLDAYMDDDN